MTNKGASLQSTHVISRQAVDFEYSEYLQFPTSINPYTIRNGNGITFSFWVKVINAGVWARCIDFQPTTNKDINLLIAKWGNADTLIFKSGLIEAKVNMTIANNQWRHIVF